jgi:DNA-directed RNA polymerase subunit RPC12/RpoP
VMNIKCIACHKSNVADGKKSGPVKCTECHVRIQ